MEKLTEDAAKGLCSLGCGRPLYVPGAAGIKRGSKETIACFIGLASPDLLSSNPLASSVWLCQQS